MSTTASKTDVVLHGRRLAPLVNEPELIAPARRVGKLWNTWPHRQSSHSRVVFSFLSDLEEGIDAAAQARAVRTRFVLFQGESPIESIPELLGKLDVRTAKRLHVARLQSDTAKSFVHRFLLSLNGRNDDDTIMDAWWEGDELVVISPTFDRLRVPVDRLAALGGMNDEERLGFEIDPHGAFLYWPVHDIHMGWSQFKQLVDPEALLRAQQKSRAFNQRYGQAIRALRQERGLSQSSILGLDGRTIRRIEKGETRATAKALACLAAAHGMTPSGYMAEVAKRLPRHA